MRDVEKSEEVEHEGQKILKAICPVCKSKMFKMGGKKSQT
jgi:uncharacterized Zn finger protein (UPF0148 family)